MSDGNGYDAPWEIARLSARIEEADRITNGRVGHAEGDIIRVSAALFHHGTEFAQLRAEFHAFASRTLDALARIEARLGEL